ERWTAEVDGQALDFGDTALVAGGWGEIQRLRDEVEDFVVLTLPAEYSELMPARHRAPIALGIMVAMVAVMAFELMANAAAVLIAALAGIGTRWGELAGIFRSVNWVQIGPVAGGLAEAARVAENGCT